ncbi:AraC family transcriptional regulator [Paenibacillus sp. R14(2021)]|uniref:AraC family transcriptional regulator n=1 Tax=Paenibacillus sp. R14(2021) TaxID=2859228 RepID=UPI001C61445F|nr:AraC family transcriptional regulator [Paenibacillus sp. R14(2021)]
MKNGNHMTANSHFSYGERLLPYASLINDHLPLYINRAYESFELRMHAHDFIEICLVTEGTGVHYIGSDQMPVARGDLFFIPVGLSHVFRPAAQGQSLVMYNCILTAEQLETLLQGIRAEPQIAEAFRGRNSLKAWFHLHDRGEEALRLFHKLHREFTAREPGFAAALCAAAIELLVLLYRRMGADLPPQEPAHSAGHASSGMREQLAFIEANCAQSLHAADIAERLGIGERQFQRSFKKATGTTFLDYVQSARIDLCCSLLLKTTDSIVEIAVRSGYQDIKFFNRLFKRKTGVTPRQYRMSMQQPRVPSS